ncbi:hypothetical protein KSF_107640 [Reticulibacter mediterranei]|uniref:XRE family transcriptional regulator n=1 Tax=Reticulibacter mediterranei TaxID=2778369 RepID=A0A8J3J4T1_9CHLR|nr:hypothetical protein [Reticulibacter mediterranei]GHP00717.1 hypothetical protein KSF_107640 [Reticulibacter mediterranei]
MQPSNRHQPSPASLQKPGRIFSHLKELLDANDLSIPRLAGLVEEDDLRPLYGLRNNSSRSFDFDLLARLCAIFDQLELADLLEYVPEGIQPSIHYQKRPMLSKLPHPYGGIRCLLLDHRNGLSATSYCEQVADELGLHWSTLANLATYRSKAVRTSTLAQICQYIGGVAQLYQYDPSFSWPSEAERQPSP